MLSEMEDVDLALELGDEIWLKFKQLVDEYTRLQELYKLQGRKLELAKETYGSDLQFVIQVTEWFMTLPNALGNKLYKEYGFKAVIAPQSEEVTKLNARQHELLDDLQAFVRRGQDRKKIVLFPTKR